MTASEQLAEGEWRGGKGPGLGGTASLRPGCPTCHGYGHVVNFTRLHETSYASLGWSLMLGISVPMPGKLEVMLHGPPLQHKNVLYTHITIR